MELKVELLPILTGGSRIAILSEDSASFLGVHSSDRMETKIRQPRNDCNRKHRGIFFE